MTTTTETTAVEWDDLPLFLPQGPERRRPAMVAARPPRPRIPRRAGTSVKRASELFGIVTTWTLLVLIFAIVIAGCAAAAIHHP